MTPRDVVRTCIGCRGTASATQLLRVVVAPGAAGTDTGSTMSGGTVAVVPDPRRSMSGRGAWLHRDPACVALAQRRRAFGRALRVPGPTDPEPVVEYVTTHYGEGTRSRHSSTTGTSGTPQETKS